MNELYRLHRPRTFKAVRGQDSAVEMLQGFLAKDAVPHVILFTGPSGTGKTTLSRIMKSKLGCSDADFHELNCADFRGIDMVRDIRNRIGLAPIGGKCRIWYIDEAHQMSSQAQNAFLKMLEDTPKHVYFIMSTTDPQKLLNTVRTRCTEIPLKSLGRDALKQTLKDIIAKEGAEGACEWEDVLDAICDYAEGSARKAVVLLNNALGVKGDAEKMMEVVKSSTSNVEAIKLARLLLSPQSAWGEVAAVLKELEEDPESLRWMILGYCTNVLLGGGKLAPRAFDIINIFERDFFSSKRAGLVSACYAVIHRK